MDDRDARLVAVPLYRQVEEHLTRKIHEGAFPPGSLLPSDARLCAQYGVSRITVRHALDGLARSNLVRRQQGVGTRVLGPDNAVKQASLFGFIDDIHPHLNLKLLDESRRVPPPTLARSMGLAENAACQCYVCINRAGKEPLSYLEAYLPDDTARFVSPEDLSGKIPLARVVEMRTGKSFAFAEQTMGAVGAPPDVAKALALQVGHPVMRMERVYFATDGTVLDATEAHYHPQRYQYSVRLVPRGKASPRQIQVLEHASLDDSNDPTIG